MRSQGGSRASHGGARSTLPEPPLPRQDLPLLTHRSRTHPTRRTQGDIALDYIEVTAGGDYESDDAPTGGWPTAVPIPAPSPEPTTPVPSPVPTTPVPSPVPTTPVPSPVPTTPVPSPVPTTPVPSPVPTALPTWVKEASFPLPLKYHVQRGAGGLSGNEGGLKARMEDGCYGTQAADYDEGKCGPPGSGYAQNSAYGTGTNCNDGFGKCTTDDS